MRVEGVELPASQAAQLALLLHKAGWFDTAQRLGTAIDTGSERFAFSGIERHAALSVLGAPPEGLAELRASLLRTVARDDPSADRA